MVEQQAADQQLNQIFQALADRTRRAMLGELAEGPQSVGALAAPHDMSLAAASKHVKVLERAGLLRREIDGRTHLCHLERAPLQDGVAWIQRLEAFWNSRLDALEQALRDADNAAEPPTTHGDGALARTAAHTGAKTP